ncbi:hypothetical protein HNR65_002415 [Desulfosalsimonas propionicica]|uniref:Uncharacterized protein n=1 Tax=Desulfosalsimonas propionicica TaxID=332175 RepID=A0A7W0HLK7_9BACT|nr:hypothetical protein [Desulfosalsimonas propionicica]MBA2882081.1 hypothetical protein [Desulfosalsimonas propionicica]
MPKLNPFHELYVTETTSPEDFVKLFSPVLVESALALFKPGNVVLMGVQGSGKSMLLNLLKTDIRLAYSKLNETLPIPEEYSNFIGAGINLTRSGALDFGQRPVDNAEEEDLLKLPLFFADFINYWIVNDIINSLLDLEKANNGRIAKSLGLKATSSNLNKFSKALSKDDCWFGYLEDSENFESLRKKINERIQTYRKFFNYNIDKIPKDIIRSKTSVGEPISKAVLLLRETKVIPEKMQVFIRIDQYEQLGHLKLWNGELGKQFKRIINKCIGLRNPNISYRIGVRKYGWETDLEIYGTSARLEAERDYKIINLDEVTKRHENRSGWIFPRFTEDVFERRLKNSGFKIPHDCKDLQLRVLGKGLSPEEKARRYGGQSPSRAVKIESTWTDETQKTLKEITKASPLSAKLYEGWLRQNREFVHPVCIDDKLPFDKKPYWKKERKHIALMQIAGRCAERMIWTGKEEVIHLSGGNILAYISICQHIWHVWVRSEHEKRQNIDNLPLPTPIPDEIQTIGIHAASTYWLNKLTEQPGGDVRKKFIDFLGAIFHKNMLYDLAMSYPGGNGFSIKNEELERDREIGGFLKQAADYGALFDIPHTTKTPDKLPRTKFYLNPIFSPYYRLPAQRTKEPSYVRISEIREWMIKAEVITKGATPRQLSLFDLETEEDK